MKTHTPSFPLETIKLQIEKRVCIHTHTHTYLFIYNFLKKKERREKVYTLLYTPLMCSEVCNG